MTDLRTGVDLGGTKIEAAVIDPSGTVLARERSVTPQGDYDATIEAVVRLVDAVEACVGGQSPCIGVGTPGSLSPVTGLIRNANSVVLNGRPLDVDLAAAIGRPAVLENDANCFALAEAVSGAGRGAEVVFGVIMGTGTGAGIVASGQCVRGANAIAGEWGHMPLPFPKYDEVPGPTCYCGRAGCVETWISGPALVRDHFESAGSHLPPDMIAAVADAGDGVAQETLARHLDRTARALSVVVNILDPDVIVLGGGLSNLPNFAPDLHSAVRPHVFSDCFRTRIVQNELGDSAGVIGAAWLCGTESI